MTRKSNAGITTHPSDAGAHIGFQELEARLLLSGSGLTAFDQSGMIEHPDNHNIYQAIENPDDDHGDDATEATFVQTDTTLIGEIEQVADQDWFEFQGQAGIQYTFETGLFSLSDTSLTLYDSDGITPLAFDDDSGAGLASLLNWTAPTQATYYIAVRGFDVETGIYSISMSDTAVPTGEIRGTKWNDINQDGIRDLDEPGLEGWVIFIDDNRNRRREPDERFVITDENGDYVFENMRPGTYTISERPKPGWEQTFPGEDGATTSTEPEPVVVPGATQTGTNQGSDGPVEFNTSGGKWDQPGGLGSTVTLTYSYSNLLDGLLPGDLTVFEIRQAIEEALNLWASFAPLKFVEVTDSGPMPDNLDTPYPASDHPDIRFGHHFIDGDEGSNVLAHAYFPADSGLAGDVHFDNGNTWSIGQVPGAFDLIEVAVHEIGHSLGLGHEPAPPVGNDAIMNPFLQGRYSGFGTAFLLDDDVAGIQALYGEVQSLLGIWSVTIANPGDIATDIDFGSFLNDDHGSDTDTASPVDAPNLINGNIESFGDVDWFSFDAVQGQSFSFETLMDDQDSDDIEDTIIRLLDQDGIVLIGTDDDSGVRLASKLPWVAPETGTYYIEVSGFNANVGEYTLRVAAAPPGDLDVDGFVGVNDLQIVLSNWNQNVPVGDVSQGDSSFDGFVGIDDLNFVLGNWNAGEQDSPPAQQASAEESTAASSEITPAAADTTDPDEDVQPVQTLSPVVEHRAHRHATASKNTDRADRTVDTRNAIAAWSRQPVRMDASPPYVSPASQTDSEDSEGLLGLWSLDEEA